MQIAQGDLTGAFKSYSDGLDILRNLSTEDLSNALWSCDVVVSLSKLASLEPRGLPAEKAVSCLREGRDTLIRMDQQGNLTARQRSLLPMLDNRIAELEALLRKKIEKRNA